MSDINIDVTKPLLEDISQLLELWKEQYQYHHELDPVYYVSYSDKVKESIESYLHELIVNQDESHIFVAKENSNFVGFITFGIEVESYFDTKIRKYGEIKEILVKKDARGKGVGAALIKKVESHFHSQGISDVKIQISSFNFTAKAIYEKLGYISRQEIFHKRLINQ